MSAIFVPYLWVVFVLFRVLKSRKLLASAVSMILLFPLYILANYMLSRIITTSAYDISTVTSLTACVVAAVILIFVDYSRGKRKIDE